MCHLDVASAADVLGGVIRIYAGPSLLFLVQAPVTSAEMCHPIPACTADVLSGVIGIYAGPGLLFLVRTPVTDAEMGHSAPACPADVPLAVERIYAWTSLHFLVLAPAVTPAKVFPSFMNSHHCLAWVSHDMFSLSGLPKELCL